MLTTQEELSEDIVDTIPNDLLPAVSTLSLSNPPQIIISFDNPQFPKFYFNDWTPGISLGTIERASNLMIRAAMEQHARFQQQLRVEDANAKTKLAEAI